MDVKIYSKLVRDCIPEIIGGIGRSAGGLLQTARKVIHVLCILYNISTGKQVPLCLLPSSGKTSQK